MLFGTSLAAARHVSEPALSIVSFFMFSKFVAAAAMALTISGAACVKAQPPTDTGNDLSVGNPVAPTTPTNPTGGTPDSSTTMAYNPDMKPIFAADCVRCHGSGRADAGYRMTTYAQVM